MAGNEEIPFQLTPMRKAESQRVAQEIGAMSRELIEHGLGWNWRPQRILRNVKRADTIAVIAHRGKRMLGFGMMRYGELRAHLLLLGVKPDVQRQGIGAAMMGWLETCAVATGCHEIVLEVLTANQRGRRFYRSLGYDVLHHMPRYYNGRVSGVRLCKQLPQTTNEMTHTAVPEATSALDAMLNPTAQLRTQFAGTLEGMDRIIWALRIDTRDPMSLFAIAKAHTVTPEEVRDTEKRLSQEWQSFIRKGIGAS